MKLHKLLKLILWNNNPPLSFFAFISLFFSPKVCAGHWLHASNSATPLPQLRKLQSPKDLQCRTAMCNAALHLKYKSRTQSLDFKPFLLIAPLSTFLFLVVLGIISDKPLLTAKRRIILLQMSIMDNPPP